MHDFVLVHTRYIPVCTLKFCTYEYIAVCTSMYQYKPGSYKKHCSCTTGHDSRWSRLSHADFLRREWESAAAVMVTDLSCGRIGGARPGLLRPAPRFPARPRRRRASTPAAPAPAAAESPWGRISGRIPGPRGLGGLGAGGNEDGGDGGV